MDVGWIFKASGHRRNPAVMQNDLGASESIRQSLEIPEVNFSVVRLTFNRSQVGRATGGQIVNDPNGIPVADKSLCQM
jgi:hypothetical protein